jgi:hypothetical protein
MRSVTEPDVERAKGIVLVADILLYGWYQRQASGFRTSPP